MPPKAKAKASSASSSSSSAAQTAVVKAPDTSQTLPSKEQTLFKQILRFYETKQYKKALKSADSILKKHSNHGETLAMKGLIFSQLQRVEEAHQLVKRGLAANLNSHVCWHVSGLLYRAEQNYDQAIKCFHPSTQLLAYDGQQHRWMDMSSCMQHQRRTATHSFPSAPALLIASYNASSSALEYHPMVGPLLIKDGHHRLVHLEQEPQRGGAVVLRVTDDHTLYVQLDREPSHPRQMQQPAAAFSSHSTSDRFFRAEARDLLVNSGEPELHVTLLASARNGYAESGGDDGGVPPCERPPFVTALGLSTEDEEVAFCEWLGAWLAVAELDDDEQPLRVAVSEAGAVERMEQLLKRLSRVIHEGPSGWLKVDCEETDEAQEGEETAREGQRGRRYFVVVEPRWRRFLAEHCGREGGTRSAEREEVEVSEETEEGRPAPRSCRGAFERLPWWVLHRCSPCHLRALLRGYELADGVSECSRSVVFTTSTSLRDDLVILCLHAGYTASFEQADSAQLKRRHRRHQRSAQQEAGAWAVWFSSSAAASHPTLSSSRDIAERPYSGRVWCLTVPPHHLVLTRTILEQGADGVVLSASLPVFAGQCYQQALKKDPNNLQILKDLSALQVQRRNFDGFTETRRKILLLKTNNRNNWLAYAIGNQLNGDVGKAIDVLDSFLHTQDDDAKEKEKAKQSSAKPALLTDGAADGSNGGGEDAKAVLQSEAQRELEAFEGRSRAGLSFELSELRLYRLSLLTEGGQWQAALDYLDSVSSTLCDSLFVLEQRADLLLRLGRVVEAEVFYRALLAINPDAVSYHSGLQATLGLSTSKEEDAPALLSLYQSLQSTFPKSSLVRRLPLDFSSGEQFVSLVRPYMQSFIRRAIPSLFVDLRPLYRDPLKAAAIERLVLHFLHHLRLHSTFDAPADQQPAQQESPACLLWTLHYAAQHFDHTGRPAEALTLLNEAVRHTPTCVDVYMVQARVYKHAGDALSAFHAMDACRRMDTADRYLNTKTVRYALRAGKADVAEELVALFLRDDADGLAALHELQVLWWEFHRGRHFERAGEPGRALKDFLYIHKHFTDIYEDQFDFHSYCVDEFTRVSLANQTSVSIASIPRGEVTSVLSYDPQRGGCVNQLTLPPYLFDQGMKECVELVLEDGRTLVCTPDHLVMTMRGEVQVQHLTSHDRVLVAPEGPRVHGGPLPGEEGWTLTYTLTDRGVATVITCRMNDPAGYARAMAFARVLGYILTDGSITRDTDGVSPAEGLLCMGHLLDAQSTCVDLALVLDIAATDIRVDPPTATQSTFDIAVPRRLGRVLHQFGCPIGKKLGQGVGLPPILLHTDTPVDFIRECLAAMFGGDGSAPQYTASTRQWLGARFFVSVTAAQRVEAAMMMEGELLALLGLFGVTGTIGEQRCTSELSTDDTWQVVLHVDATSTLSFAENVGFRHCIHKQQRMGVAAGYYRGVQRRLDQKQRLVESILALHRAQHGAWPHCIAHAVAQMRAQEVLLSNVVESTTLAKIWDYAAGRSKPGNRGRAIYKTADRYINDVGAVGFFNPGVAVSGSSARVYAVPRHLTALPTWHLGVEGTRPVGPRRTFDLSVTDTHLFIANGIVAHNCLRKLTLRAYLALLRWEDTIRGHKFFVRACVGIIRIYVQLWDAARDKERRELREREDSTLSEEERKAAVKRQKKEAAKQKKKQAQAEEDKKAADEAARKAAAVAGSAAAKNGNGKAQSTTAPPDPDPLGESHLGKEPLAEASRFLAFLQMHSAAALSTHLWAMEVQLRKARWLLAWKAIKQARKLDVNNAEVHFGLMRWLEGLQHTREQLQPLVREVLEEDWTEAGHDGSPLQADIAQLNERHLHSHLDSLDHRFAVARSLLLSCVGAERSSALRLLQLQVEAEDGSDGGAALHKPADSAVSAPPHSRRPRLSATFPSLQPLRPFPLSLALQVLDWMGDADPAASSAWATAMHAAFPFATAFGAVSSQPPQLAASQAAALADSADQQPLPGGKQSEGHHDDERVEDAEEDARAAAATTAVNGTAPH